MEQPIKSIETARQLTEQERCKLLGIATLAIHAKRGSEMASVALDIYRAAAEDADTVVGLEAMSEEEIFCTIAAMHIASVVELDLRLPFDPPLRDIICRVFNLSNPTNN